MTELEKLQRRKAELKAQIEQESKELRQTAIEFRKELEPANLLKKAVGGVLGFTPGTTDAGTSALSERLPAPVKLLADIFLKDSKWAFVAKFIAPLVLKYWPRSASKPAPKAGEELPETAPERPSDSLKVKTYGKLRQGISSLRRQLRKKKTTPDGAESDNTEK